MSIPCPSSVLQFFQKKKKEKDTGEICIQKCLVFDMSTILQMKYLYFLKNT